MMFDNCIHINNLSCGYSNKEVLKVENLSIPNAKLTFVVGHSGVGKSTLIEILGMMNTPILNKEKYQINYRFNGSEFDHNLLQSTKKLSNFRSKHLSFLFQENNLLPHYSGRENILMGAVSSENYQPSNSSINKYCEALNLDPELLSRSISKISGGEKKRVAFIRSLMKDYNLLFGDEPTGNLDIYSSRLLMRSLKNILTREQKSAVIVSHDIDLALEFADMIVVVTSENGRGVIRKENIYIKETNQQQELKKEITKLLVA